MAKKKDYPVAIGALPYGYTDISDNNPDGPSPLPDDRLDGTRHPEGKMSFVNNVAAGESPEAPDVNTITPNGVSKSSGEGHNCQWNWWKGTGGIWNKNKPWTGGNMTGQ